MSVINRRLSVYIDGFSFYYGITRGTPHKWVNLFVLSQRLFPNDNISNVKLFAGRSLSTPNNPKAPERQNAYFRALRSIPDVQIIDSEFRAYARELPLAKDHTKKAEVMVYKEKKSDVNLATSMVIDAVFDEYDCAVIITNDIDFVEPIKRVRYTFGKPVYLVPTILEEKEKKDKKSFVANELLRFSTNKKFINLGMLKSSQLPDKLKDSRGSIHRPIQW